MHDILFYFKKKKGQKSQAHRCRYPEASFYLLQWRWGPQTNYFNGDEDPSMEIGDHKPTLESLPPSSMEIRTTNQHLRGCQSKWSKRMNWERERKKFHKNSLIFWLELWSQKLSFLKSRQEHDNFTWSSVAYIHGRIFKFLLTNGKIQTLNYLYLKYDLWCTVGQY